MSDFSDRPYVAGSLIGIRSFKVDETGRLRGVNYSTVFRPGENVGRCLASDAGTVSFSISNGTVTWGPPGSKLIDRKHNGEHRVGQAKCGCGFYAYFDEGPNRFHEAGHVLGLVEGYGVCTVGSRGFRCEKARILALIEPEPVKPLWRYVPWWIWAVGVLCLATVAFEFIESTGPWWQAFECAVFSAYVSFYATSAVRRRRKDIQLRAAVPEHVRRNYDVPVLSRADALARFPLTVPPAPTPDDDPEFWTRGDLT